MAKSDYRKTRDFLIFAALLIVGIKSITSSGLLEPSNIKGYGFSMDIPQGFVRNKEETKRFRTEGSLYETEVFVYDSPVMNAKREMPEARLSVTTRKLSSAIWLEDQIGDIYNSIRQAGYNIQKTGQMDLGGQSSDWVIFEDKEKTITALEFYTITDNNIFYKIQFVCDADKFPLYAPVFENARKTWMFEFKLY